MLTLRRFHAWNGFVTRCRRQWMDREDTEARALSVDESDTLFFERAIRQYLTSGDPNSQRVKDMHEALQVKTLGLASLACSSLSKPARRGLGSYHEYGATVVSDET